MKSTKILFIGIAILGIIIIITGIRLVNNVKEETKSYVETTGYYVGKRIGSSDEDGTTYILSYEYTVNGIDYNVDTNYSTSIIPKIGSTKIIKYNPENPSESIISGFIGEWIVVICGSIFFIIPMLMLFCGNKYVKDENTNNSPIKIPSNNVDSEEIRYKNMDEFENTYIEVDNASGIVDNIDNIRQTVSNNKIVTGFMKVYYLIFFILWFGFLIIFDYISIKNGLWIFLIYSIIFWVAGIHSLKRLINKN